MNSIIPKIKLQLIKILKPFIYLSDILSYIFGKPRQKTQIVLVGIFVCLFIFYYLEDITLNKLQLSNEFINKIKFTSLGNFILKKRNLTTSILWNLVKDGPSIEFSDGKEGVDNVRQNQSHKKVVLLWTAFFNSPTWYHQNVDNAFNICKYNSCILSTQKKRDISSAHAVLMHYRDLTFINAMPPSHPNNQIWIFFLVESPYHTCDFIWLDYCNLKKYDDVFNWTGTYLSHSDIAVPYVGYHKKMLIPEEAINSNFSPSTLIHQTFISKDQNRTQELGINDTFSNLSYHTTAPILALTPTYTSGKGENLNRFNYAAGKTKLAVTFISNCNTPNNRIIYIKELSNYLKPHGFDFFGKCGADSACPKQDPACERDLLRPYKFYLAFENSNCVEYITEKVHRGLTNGLVPVVYGARYEDYLSHLPPGSFIYISSSLNERQPPTHVSGEDAPNVVRLSPHHPYFGTYNLKQLADYLVLLASNDTLYNAYHAWRSQYDVGFGPDHESYLCQICRHLHLGDIPPKSYKISQWWNKDTACETWNLPDTMP